MPLVASAAAPHPRLEVRLQNHLTSYSSKSGTPFECVVLRTFHEGELTIPQNSIVRGVVQMAQSVGIGFRHERASLLLRFETYETPDGHTYPLNAVLSSIDNAREEINAHGQIRGVLAANNPGNLLNGFWMRPSSNIALRSLVGLTGAANQIWAKYSMGPFGAAGLFVARCAIMRFPEPEIHLPPGTDMKLAVILSGTGQDPGEEGPLLIPASTRDSVFAADFADWLQPFLGALTYTNGRVAPDRINIVVLGSRERLFSAFQVAGWWEADRRTWSSSSRVYSAFSAMRSYDSAPVSPMLFHNTLPDVVFEKSLDTVVRRHHVRFWKAGAFHGREVWLGAATHDSGVSFRLASFAFTHKIDSNIDLERQKILTDLNFAGCSANPLLIDSPSVETRDQQHITTDGRILVLEARSCTESNSAPPPAPPPPGTRLTRLTRRVVLETRNYLFRDNAYYWAYRMLRTSRRHTAAAALE